MKYAFILGIDVASTKLDFCLLDQQGEKHFWSINNNLVSLTEFYQTNLANLVNPDNLLVALESTGDYHLQPAQFFLTKGHAVKLINPILTRQYTKTTIRGAKTDKQDSELIAKLALAGEGNWLSLEKISNQRKNLLRLGQSLTKTATKLKHQVSSLKRKSVSVAGLEDSIQGIENIIKQLKQLENKLNQQITKNRPPAEELIDSIPGFASKLSAIVSEEIGDISRFKNVKALVAYAGLDPKIKQSGGKQINGRITKRGSTHLRAALYLAAHTARRYDPDLKQYYEKKIAEGRKYSEVMVMISRKLLARIYAVLKEQREYVVKDS